MHAGVVASTARTTSAERTGGGRGASPDAVSTSSHWSLAVAMSLKGR